MQFLSSVCFILSIYDYIFKQIPYYHKTPPLKIFNSLIDHYSHFSFPTNHYY
jgi:hypothetical protein